MWTAEQQRVYRECTGLFSYSICRDDTRSAHFPLAALKTDDYNDFHYPLEESKEIATGVDMLPQNLVGSTFVGSLVVAAPTCGI